MSAALTGAPVAAADAASAAPPAARRRVGQGRRGLRLPRWSLGALVASGCIAFVEPSPYEVMFLISFPILLVRGFKLARGMMPMIGLFLLYNLGGLFSLVPYLDVQLSVTFVAISFYLALTAIVFAGAMLDDTAGRMRAIENGAIIGGLVASCAGIIGFFNVAGLGSLFAMWGESRASGTFKDPNVLGPFLVFPMIVLMQRLLVGQTRRPILSLVMLSVLSLSIFLTFSRGAWGVLILGALVLVALSFISARTGRLRRRVVLTSLLAVGGVAVVLLVALSDDRIREIFLSRASLSQSYDVGYTGRFGNQLRSLPRLFDSPNGIGPLRFYLYYKDAPHNVYINAFASYGWLGGISYLALVAATLVVGFMAAVQRTPWQAHTIAVWAALFPQIVQGFQIDTDHWRHMLMLWGLIWGLACANRAFLDQEKREAALAGAEGGIVPPGPAARRPMAGARNRLRQPAGLPISGRVGV